MDSTEIKWKGHLLAAVTVVIWGTTFISTKVLLEHFTPLEILFFRFCIGLLALCIIYPKRLKVTDRGQELYFAAAGICGVTLYFLMENIALTLTQASNVGVIVSAAPFFTGLLAHIALKGEELHLQFFIGFACAIAGIALISFQGTTMLELNPVGDILSLGAAIVWAVYSVLTKKISGYGYHTIQTTRRIFGYGIVFMLPALFFMPFEWGLHRLTDAVNLYNILYLGFGASALCFVSWNQAVKILGAVKTSIYIYLVPVITIVASVLILHETITLPAVIGTVMILMGLVLSEKRK